MRSKLAKDFNSFADLAAAYSEGQDYRIVNVPRPASSVAVIAPHGGNIEAFTSDIARGIAAEQFGLYLFEGLLRAGNFAALHLRSDRFDEPGCLDWLTTCDRVVSVHGYGSGDEKVLLGGRDQALRESIVAQLAEAGIASATAPAGLAGTDPYNICNRGRSGAGVQLEISLGLRRSARRGALVLAVHKALLA